MHCDAPFVVRRYDADITIMPFKYLEEMRAIPRSKLNCKMPQIHNLVPKWTWAEFMYDSDLIVRVLNGQLNRNLPKYVDIARSELEYAWDIEIPQTDEWAEVDIQQIFRRLVSRMSAKVFMGYPACRDQDWINLSIGFTHDMFVAAFTLRMFPPWTHRYIAPLVPARRRMWNQIKTAERIVGNLVKKRDDARNRGDEVEDTLLGWMMDNGNETETRLGEMAFRQCFLTLASIHTTSVSVSTVLFDLCDHPEWFPVLREEIEQVTAQYGPIGEHPGMTSRQWIAKLMKMDSFIIEMQRTNPQILLRPQRVAMVPLTLKDGTTIPQGARVAWAGHHHANDPSILTSDPEAFDPMRSYRKRTAYVDEDGENPNKYTAVDQSDMDTLAFGYGGQACPGRYFAIGEIKLVLSRMLVQFDFAYPKGKSRPKRMYADENTFIDAHATLMMRKRKV
ncbi:hypothetical protein N8I77_013312 [Diaporthe amygdali]|uniref:Cytochrome P450 n=1 Tax=Phomopsis amygdali TaxID=1214568 RepID=A0AAD9VWL7_PHOAM|nr:hypothetical protein N8I77_013312 [Diaporthe amygdali]